MVVVVAGLAGDPLPGSDTDNVSSAVEGGGVAGLHPIKVSSSTPSAIRVKREAM
jgi:hypothetical protein